MCVLLVHVSTLALLQLFLLTEIPPRNDVRASRRKGQAGVACTVLYSAVRCSDTIRIAALIQCVCVRVCVDICV